MHVQAETKPYDTINVTPMLDLAYVLLVVFIIMTTASVQGLTVSMPKPSNKPATEKHEIRVVQITPEGRLLLNGMAVSEAELESQLTALRNRDAGASVAIKGDAASQYAMVMRVVDLCNRVQIGMGLVTARIGT